MQPSGKGVGDIGAAAAAGSAVLAATTLRPELIDGELAIVGKSSWVAPYLGERSLPDIAFGGEGDFLSDRAEILADQEPEEPR